MCAIAGIYAYNHVSASVDREELIRTRDHMAVRGPDGSGLWISKDRRLGLAHRRLAIIDLSSNGLQPMQSCDGRLVVSFNGEIYNHLLLRAELEKNGYHFSTASDTEVLLHLYADRGPAMVSALRGMFAFALWDSHSKKLLLARDAYGIKPLYYADERGTVRFASQVKALLSSGKISNELDEAGQVGFYLFGSIPEPFTTHRSIRSVPAGSTIIVDANGCSEPSRYFSVSQALTQGEAERLGTIEEQARTVKAALLDSVRHHLVSDVPVGAFLSSGIDSSALVGLMRDAGASGISTITIKFSEFMQTANDEAPLASQVASHYGTQHHERLITRDEFLSDLPAIFKSMDQPSIDGINTWFVSKAAREIGLKVAISGLGGDELFGGYPSFNDLPRWVRTFGILSKVPGLAAAVRWLVKGIGPNRLRLNPKAAGMVELGGTYAGSYLLRRGLFMPWELDQILDLETIKVGLTRLRPLELIAAEACPPPREPFSRVAALESSLYMKNQLLRDADWASMAHSIEVRFPLVDRQLLQIISRNDLARRTFGKKLLAMAPSRALPESILRRSKTGFVMPIAAWTDKLSSYSNSASVPWARAWSKIVASHVAPAWASASYGSR
jgi:asparagine synthase (glutamine-hydrolysing)